MMPSSELVYTATTQKTHWNSSSIVMERKSKELSANLFSSTMLADAVQYAMPASTGAGSPHIRLSGLLPGVPASMSAECP